MGPAVVQLQVQSCQQDHTIGDKQRQINQQGHMTFNGRELEDHFPVKLEALKDAGKTKW